MVFFICCLMLCSLGQRGTSSRGADPHPLMVSDFVGCVHPTLTFLGLRPVSGCTGRPALCEKEQKEIGGEHGAALRSKENCRCVAGTGPQVAVNTHQQGCGCLQLCFYNCDWSLQRRDGVGASQRDWLVAGPHGSVLPSRCLWRLLVSKTQAMHVIKSGRDVITLTCVPYGTWRSLLPHVTIRNLGLLPPLYTVRGGRLSN